MDVSPHISGFLRDTAPDIPHHRQNTILMTLRTLRQAMGPMRNLLPKIQEQVMANHKAGRGDSS